MKALQERLQECVNIRQQMRACGIDEDPALDRLKADMVTFVKDGCPRYGRVRLSRAAGSAGAAGAAGSAGAAGGNLAGKALRYVLATEDDQESFVQIIR